MLVFNGKETSKSILKEQGYGNDNNYKNGIDLFVNGLNLSLLDILNQKPDETELGLFMFGNDPRTFISFKEKIKILLHNNVKVGFYHLSESNKDINTGLELIDKITNLGGKIIIQLPINDKNIFNRIKELTTFQDIDNLKLDSLRFGCTQSAILGLSNHIINKYGGQKITVIGSEGFIGKGIVRGLKISYPSLEINGIDKKINLNYEENQSTIKNSDLIISTASEIVNFPNEIKKGTSIIDCGLIRGDLGIRGSITMKEGVLKNCNIITPTPGGIGPLEMLYLVLKVKNISNERIDYLLSKNIVLNEF